MSPQEDSPSSAGRRDRAALTPAHAHDLLGLARYSEGAVVSRTLAKGPAGTFTAFAFDAGEGLSEHSAPFDAYLAVLEGTCDLVIGGEEVQARAGQLVLMPATVPHSVHAPERCKLLLVMLKQPPS